MEHRVIFTNDISTISLEEIEVRLSINQTRENNLYRLLPPHLNHKALAKPLKPLAYKRRNLPTTLRPLP